jgi:hypothetical protein
LTIADCETGNPPEGWESEGQLRIENLLKSLKKSVAESELFIPTMDKETLSKATERV